jgi:hypothetical protein
MSGEALSRRADDGPGITFREAVQMFASKDELLAMRQSIEGIHVQVGALPTRGEWDIRTKYDDDFRIRTEQGIKDLTDAINAVPGKLSKTIGLIVGVLMTIATIVNFFLAHWK